MAIVRIEVRRGAPTIVTNRCPVCGQDSVYLSNDPSREVLLCPCGVDKMATDAIAEYERGETIPLRSLMGEE